MLKREGKEVQQLSLPSLPPISQIRWEGGEHALFATRTRTFVSRADASMFLLSLWKENSFLPVQKGLKSTSETCKLL